MFGKKLTQDQKFACGSGFRGKNRPEHSLRMQGTNNPMRTTHSLENLERKMKELK